MGTQTRHAQRQNHFTHQHLLLTIEELRMVMMGFMQIHVIREWTVVERRWKRVKSGVLQKVRVAALVSYTVHVYITL